MNMSLLVLGLILFLGTHSIRIFADGWRNNQFNKLGEARWKGLYRVVSLVGFVLMVWGYGEARAGAPLIWHSEPWTRHIVALFTLPAFVLLVAAYVPGTRIKEKLGHPMVLGVLLWALSHLLANGTVNAVLLFGSFLLWAIVDFLSLRGRDRADGRSYPAAAGWSRDILAVAIGVVAWWLFARYGHEWLNGVRPIG